MKNVKDIICALVAMIGIAIVGFIIMRQYDPPWSVRQVQGTVIGWGSVQSPKVVIQHYRSTLAVKSDDGRLLSVESERYVPPPIGERIIVQERIGLFCTLKYVEVPARGP
jgi:hypothetical protein